ncbi:MAG: hypothetical protein JW987_00335 [Anaerolineaceae bacterium]|nr:hypothetical protein [Anaerolineaceae bacterium]
MDDPVFAKLSAEQLAALNDEQKAIYSLMVSSDQDFFAATFKPADLPGVLERKGEIMRRNQELRERLEQLKAAMAKNAAALAPASASGEGLGNALGMAGALGLGAAAAVASDNTAHYRGVQPVDLAPALRSEFGSGNTTISFSGAEDSLLASVGILTDRGAVTAMTVQLTSRDDGTEVRVNDLTRQGVLETVKEGAKNLVGLAGQGLSLLTGRKDPARIYNAARQAVENGSDLAEVAGNFKLKERAWKVIKAAAESLEKAHMSRVKEEREARERLEKAWDSYYNCPNCGVSFADADLICRVCGTDRPDQPMKPDPRRQ